jgi:hypothetical protein
MPRLLALKAATGPGLQWTRVSNELMGAGIRRSQGCPPGTRGNRMKATTPNLNRVEHPASPRVPQDAAHQECRIKRFDDSPDQSPPCRGGITDRDPCFRPRIHPHPERCLPKAPAAAATSASLCAGTSGSSLPARRSSAQLPSRMSPAPRAAPRWRRRRP